jgi:hypothetical protein
LTHAFASVGLVSLEHIQSQLALSISSPPPLSDAFFRQLATESDGALAASLASELLARLKDDHVAQARLLPALLDVCSRRELLKLV